MLPIKFKTDFRKKEEPPKNHVQLGLEKLQARRGIVPAYDEKEKDERPRDLNDQVLNQGGRHKSRRRKTRRRKTHRRR